MTLSLRLLARSRCLRAVGVLAWLMLAVSSLVAAPAGMGSHAASARHAVAAVGEHSHHGMHDGGAAGSCRDGHAGCRGGQAGLGCHCTSMCSNALPPCAGMDTDSVAFTATYGSPVRTRAPSPMTAPPLRPPAV